MERILPMQFKVLILGCSLSCLLAIASDRSGFVMAQSAEPPQTAKGSHPDFQQLVLDLSSPSFATRQHATEQLGNLGESIVDALESAVERVDDLEARSRMVSLLTEFRQVRLRRQLSEFRADPNLENDHGLGAWRPFAQRVGATRVAKLMLIEMYQSQPELMRQVGSNEPLVPLIAKSATRFLNQSNLRGPGNPAALLLASTLAKEPIPNEIQFAILQSVYSDQILVRLTDPRWQNENKKLVGAWISTLSKELSREGLRLASKYNLPEGIELARASLGNLGRDPIALLDAMRVFAVHGVEQDLALLEPLLKGSDMIGEVPSNTTLRTPIEDRDGIPAWSERQLLQVYMQDVVLAACVQIRKLDPREFFPNFNSEKWTEFRLNDVGFTIDQRDQREAAIERWMKLRSNSDGSAGSSS